MSAGFEIHGFFRQSHRAPPVPAPAKSHRAQPHRQLLYNSDNSPPPLRAPAIFPHHRASTNEPAQQLDTSSRPSLRHSCGDRLRAFQECLQEIQNRSNRVCSPDRKARATAHQLRPAIAFHREVSVFANSDVEAESPDTATLHPKPKGSIRVREKTVQPRAFELPAATTSNRRASPAPHSNGLPRRGAKLPCCAAARFPEKPPQLKVRLATIDSYGLQPPFRPVMRPSNRFQIVENQPQRIFGIDCLHTVSHRLPPGIILHQRKNLREKSAQRFRIDHQTAALLLKISSICLLMIISRIRIRNQNRRRPAADQLCDRSRSGARQNKIGTRKKLRNLIGKRHKTSLRQTAVFR